MSSKTCKQWCNKGNSELYYLFIAADSMLMSLVSSAYCSVIRKHVLPKSGFGSGRIWVKPPAGFELNLARMALAGFELVKYGTTLFLSNLVCRFTDLTLLVDHQNEHLGLKSSVISLQNSQRSLAVPRNPRNHSYVCNDERVKYYVCQVCTFFTTNYLISLINYLISLIVFFVVIVHFFVCDLCNFAVHLVHLQNAVFSLMVNSVIMWNSIKVFDNCNMILWSHSTCWRYINLLLLLLLIRSYLLTYYVECNYSS